MGIASNLLARDFFAAAPNCAWVGDITYVPKAVESVRRTGVISGCLRYTVP
jgi:hypothetical protein